MSNNIVKPEEFFGHRLGADRKLAHWNKIVEYFWELNKSPMVHVEELGKSTEGNPFLLAIITSEKNYDFFRDFFWNCYIIFLSAGIKI